ncbi:MAG: hypothetical protein ACT4OK_16215 [Gemmobacter sp.]
MSRAYGSGTAQPDVLDRFHGSRLRIGDALLACDCGANVALPAPRSLHEPKDGGAWQDWCAPGTQRDAGFRQAKEVQIAPGPGVNPMRVRMTDTRRTAINPDTQRAADGQFYGLQALAEGQSFIARIEGDAGLVSDAVSALKGDQVLGRSRSAEFGRVKIEALASVPPLPPAGTGDATYLWCLSDLAAHDRHFQPTERPDGPVGADYPGFFGTEIDWSRSFVRHRSYAPFNAHWKARQPERLVIARGSVIVLKAGIAPGLLWRGFHQEQGLGQVLACTAPPIEIIKGWQGAAGGAAPSVAKAAAPETPLSRLLAERANTAKSRREGQDKAREAVGLWMDRYGAAEGINAGRCGPTPSQWGPLARMEAAEMRRQLEAARGSASEKESTAWQARFDKDEPDKPGTFVAALLAELGPAGASDAAARLEHVRRLAHALRAELTSLGYFDGR